MIWLLYLWRFQTSVFKKWCLSRMFSRMHTIERSSGRCVVVGVQVCKSSCILSLLLRRAGPDQYFILLAPKEMLGWARSRAQSGWDVTSATSNKDKHRQRSPSIFYRPLSISPVYPAGDRRFRTQRHWCRGNVFQVCVFKVLCFSVSMNRYQYYLQVKKDVLEGRLRCTLEQVIRLAGLAVQGKREGGPGCDVPPSVGWRCCWPLRGES